VPSDIPSSLFFSYKELNSCLDRNDRKYHFLTYYEATTRYVLAIMIPDPSFGNSLVFLRGYADWDEKGKCRDWGIMPHS
jgi:hypothetical protein